MEVAVLNTLAAAAMGTTVEVVSVACTELLDILVVATAVARSGRIKAIAATLRCCTNARLGVAACHDGKE